MASNKRMTIIDFAKPSPTRSFLVRSEDCQLYYVDPNFLKMWSGAFRRFLEQFGETQPEFCITNELKGDQLHLFLQVIHAQALIDCTDYTEISNFIDAIDSLDAPEGLKEATAFHCLLRCKDIEDARLLIKSLIILNSNTALVLLQHFIDALNNRLNLLSLSVDEQLLNWMLGKGNTQISQQILTLLVERVQEVSPGDPNSPLFQNYQHQQQHLNLQYEQQYQQKQQQAKQAIVDLFYYRMQEHLCRTDLKQIKMDLKFVLSDSKRISSNRCLLINQSAAFNSWLGGDFKDSSQQIIQLPEETSTSYDDHMFHGMLPTLAGCIWRFSSPIQNIWPQLRICVCFLGIKDNTQQLGQQCNDWSQITHALQKLFEVTDKYDILAMNSFFTDEIIALAQQFNIADLIAIGDRYQNVRILDAGFGNLHRGTARQMVVENEKIWLNYSLLTKERFIAAIGKLLCANH